VRLPRLVRRPDRQSRSISAGLRYFNDFYPTAPTMLEEIVAGGLMLTPSVEDAEEEVLETIDYYFQGAMIGGLSRVQLFAIARELTGSFFGRRQNLFERYFTGEPARAYSSAFNRLNLPQVRKPVDKLLTAAAPAFT